MKTLFFLLFPCSVLAAGDMDQLSLDIGNSVVAFKSSVDLANANLASDKIRCSKIAAWKKRDACYSTANTVYNSAINAASNGFSVGLINESAFYLGVPATFDAVWAEIERLQAIQLALYFAAEQARIDACIASIPLEILHNPEIYGESVCE